VIKLRITKKMVLVMSRCLKIHEVENRASNAQWLQ